MRATIAMLGIFIGVAGAMSLVSECRNASSASAGAQLMNGGKNWKASLLS
jgi:hypothetical protein